MYEANTWGSRGQTPSVYLHHEPSVPTGPLEPPPVPEPWPIADDDEECDEEYDDWWDEDDDDEDDPDDLR